MKNSDDSGYTGKHVGVCVLDTGIFPHIDFTGRILAFQDFIGHRIRPYDDNSHGTHVCGIIGGDGRASEGRIRGIAPGCSLIVLKVLDRTGNGRKEDVLQAFRWILEIINRFPLQLPDLFVRSLQNCLKMPEKNTGVFYLYIREGFYKYHPEQNQLL